MGKEVTGQKDSSMGQLLTALKQTKHDNPAFTPNERVVADLVIQRQATQPPGRVSGAPSYLDILFLQHWPRR
jgi:hypothetical protein